MNKWEEGINGFYWYCESESDQKMNQKMVYTERHRFIFCINDYSQQFDQHSITINMHQISSYS